jgi:hypothetical protein
MSEATNRGGGLPLSGRSYFTYLDLIFYRVFKELKYEDVKVTNALYNRLKIVEALNFFFSFTSCSAGLQAVFYLPPTSINNYV